MYTQSELETILSVSVVLLLLAASVNIYWILLSSRQINAIRRAFARWVRRWEKDHRIESYIKGLRGLAEDE